MIRKLTKNNYRVTVVTRSIHQKGNIIKTQGNAGFINVVEANVFEENKIKKLFEEADICINLIGILYEKKKNQFDVIHSDLPSLLSKSASKSSLKQFIHLSALGIELATDSKYAISKLKGEKKIRQNFSDSVILKPSIVYSIDDNLFVLRIICSNNPYSSLSTASRSSPL